MTPPMSAVSRSTYETKLSESQAELDHLLLHGRQTRGLTPDERNRAQHLRAVISMVHQTLEQDDLMRQYQELELASRRRARATAWAIGLLTLCFFASAILAWKVPAALFSGLLVVVLVLFMAGAQRR